MSSLIDYENLINSEDFFALDISGSRIKLMWTEGRKGKHLGLKSFATKKIPASAIAAGIIRRKDVVATAITSMIAEAKPHPVRSKFVAISIPQEKVLIKIDKFPDIADDKLEKAIEWKAESILALPLAGVYWNYRKLEKKAGDSTVDVMLAAVEKGVVDSYIETVKLAGLIPISVEMDTAAAIRAILNSAEIVKDTTPIILLNIGNTHSAIAIYHRGGIRFSSSLQIGGSHIEKIVSSIIGNTEESISEFLRTQGFEAKDEKTANDIKVAVEPLIREIKNALYFYSETLHDEEKIGRMLVYGDGSLTKGLCQHIQSNFEGVEVKVANPKLNFLPIPQFIAREKIAPQLVVAGLSIRGTGKSGKYMDANFIPEADKKYYVSTLLAKKFSALTRIFFLNAVCISVALGGSLFLLNLRNQTQEEKIAMSESLINASRVQEIATEVEVVNKSLDTINGLIQIELDWIPSINGIISNVPDNVSLTNLDIYVDSESTTSTTPAWRVDIFGTTTDREQITNYYNRLITSGIFEKVTQPVSNFSTTSTTSFEINATLSVLKVLKDPEAFKKLKSSTTTLELRPIQTK